MLSLNPIVGDPFGINSLIDLSFLSHQEVIIAEIYGRPPFPYKL